MAVKLSQTQWVLVMLLSAFVPQVICSGSESPVEFGDANLKAAVEDELWIDDPTPTDMLELDRLSVVSEDIYNIVGLEYATNIQALSIRFNHVSNLSPLSSCDKLKTLNISKNYAISDLSPIVDKTSLTYLECHDNLIEDLSSIAQLVNLTHLGLKRNLLNDVSGLAQLVNLTTLHLESNQISDITPLCNLTGLTKLALSSNEIADISMLSNLSNLEELAISYNSITDVSVLASLPNLQKLLMRNMDVSDISSLCQLNQLESLDLDGTPINQQAYQEHLALILQNNPSISLFYDSNPSAPENLSQGQSSLGIQICWDSVPNGPSYTSYYRVYRSTGSSSTQEAISDWQLETCFEDTSVQGGQSYRYWVQCAVSSDGDEAGDMSDPLVTQATSSYGLTITSGTYGNVTVPGEGTFEYSQATTVDVEAVSTDSNTYSFAGWTGSAVNAGKVQDASLACTTVTVDGNYTLQANFGSSIQCELVVVSDGNGTATGAGSYDYGSTVAIHAVAESHYHFDHWTVSGEASVADTTAADSTVTLQGDGTVTAHFTLDNQTLTLSSETGGEILSPGEGTFTYEYDASVTLLAQADSGYVFSHWSGNICSVQNPLTLSMTSNYEVIAHFEPILHSLQVNSTAGGIVLYPEDQTGEYLEGTSVSVEVEITDSNLFSFAGWTGSAVNAGSVLDPNTPSTAVIMNDDYTLKANFWSRLEVIHVKALNDEVREIENGTEQYPFENIQEAIDVAQNHSAIRVHEGRYYEQLDFLGKTLDLVGLDPCGVDPVSLPILDANGLGCGLSVDSNSLIIGLVLTGGSSALLCENCEVTLAHCLLVGNPVEVNEAVMACIDSNLVMVHCTVADNLEEEIRLQNSSLEILNSIVWGASLESLLLDDQSLLEQHFSDSSYLWPGTGNLQEDPLFYQTGLWQDLGDGNLFWQKGDYHLQSTYGRWNQDGGTWEYDDQTSPCIGASDPNGLMEYSLEQGDGNNNCGAYGGTPMASKGQE